MTTADTPRRRTLTWPPALLAAAALALALSGCGEGEPDRDAAGRLEGSSEVRLLTLRAGDCVANLRHSLENPDGGHNGVPKVKAVPCSERHDGEVLRIAELGDGEFPGEQIVLGEVARGRQDLQPRLTGANAAGKLTLVSFGPTQERWEFEDQHEIVYLVLYGQARTGTL